jgi:Tfp pilus assembly protein PilF
VSPARVALRIAALLACLSAAGCSSCRRSLEVPDAVYREAVSAFYTGLAALQTSQEPLARQKFERVTAIVPEEPAAWANLGLLFLRQQELDTARERLSKAAELAPDNAPIQGLLGLVESRKGNPAEAIAHWKRAIELDPGDLRSAFALGQETARQGGDAHEAEAQQVFAGIVTRSGNLAARLELARLAAKRGDRQGLQQALGPLGGQSKGWPPEAQAQLAAVQSAAAGDPRAAATRITFLKNVLQRVPDYRLAYSAVTTPLEALGQPLMQLIALKNPDPHPAPADEALTFTVERMPGDAAWAGTFSAGGEGSPAVITAGPTGLALGGKPITAVSGTLPAFSPPGTVLPIDVNYDFRTDLVMADAKGVHVLRQEADGRFTDVTAATTLPESVLSAPATAVWGADVDLDGDLDLVLAPVSGPPVELRNNNDGTLTALTPFPGVPSLRGFAWADLDGDGVPDASLLDAAGALHVLINERGFGFAERQVPAPGAPVAAIAVADVGPSAAFDVILATAKGEVMALSLAPGAEKPRTLATLDTVPAGFGLGAGHITVSDLDNNGASDLVVAGPRTSRVLLGGAGAEFRLLPQVVDVGVAGTADLDGSGRIALVGLSGAGQAARTTSRGSKAYHWQVYRPRAANTLGDQRINSFGIGGEVEVRTGLHAQKQAITSPLVHFGLGDARRADVVRIVWPNGTLQSEFDRPADTVVLANQRLKGSCPWLFGWNGREMAFLTDLIWRSPLGLRINAQDTADVVMTEDRVRIPGDRLEARDGEYDLRITAELWETHFFDLVSLVAVDHPAGTEVFLDERFSVPPPSLDAIVTGPVQAFSAARDDGGRDVRTIVSARDDEHLDFAGRGAYQGITRDHFVELELPTDAPRDGPLYLVAQGWIHPTDSSVNVAISQGAHARPRGLSLSVADAAGRFREVRPNLGFPAGKDKTILVNLGGVFPASGPRRLRLSTNLEIFWDRLGWAVGRPDVGLAPVGLSLNAAELVYRGYSVTSQHAPSSPERPRYELEGTAPRWLDLEGYYTRFGDVRPLVGAVDDRYVIMNAGDELRLRFRAAAPPPGTVRDFILVSNGWVKDGDYNTTASRTVLPLPTHAHARYVDRPSRLEDDPVYRAHPQDFSEYHTRYATPAPARDALSAVTP